MGVEMSSSNGIPESMNDRADSTKRGKLAKAAMRFSVLGSGSGGNATLLECQQTRLLIDAGLSAKQILLRLDQLNIKPESLDGIVLTHEHGDHARGVDVLLRNRNIPVYANALTKEAMSWSMKSTVSWRVFETGQPFRVGDVEVFSFPIPHDAADPVAFVIEGSGARFGVLTDVGYVTQGMIQNLQNLDAFFVEANYDEKLLEEDTKRPWATKQRIASKHGHLSNTQASELIAQVASERLSEIMLVHLSSDCNCPQKAIERVRSELGSETCAEVNVSCASQNEVSSWIHFGEVVQAEEVAPTIFKQGQLF